MVFSTNGAGTTGQPHAKKNEGLILFTKMNSKWIIDLDVKCRTIKLLANNIDENLDNLGYGDDFSDTTPKAQSMKEITDKLDFFKSKNWDFSDGPVVKTLPSNAGGAGSIPGQGAKITYASGPKNQNIKERSSIVTNSIKTLKMVHIKKKIFKKN